jgi:hypothetical protein
VYPDERVVRLIEESFLPVRIHVKENPKGFERFGAQWTPTVVLLDAEGVERHRFEGFLPVDEYLAQLTIGLGKLAFAHNAWGEAERRFQEAASEFPDSSAAPEALYWAGVSKYKATGDAAALKETASAFDTRYRDTAWAKRASVWAA